MKDYYAVLGVGRDASPDEIKRAYRRLARRYHPDANKDDPAAEEKIKEINEAYEVLSDPEKRSRYDMFGSADFPAPGGFGGATGGAYDPFASLNDLIEDFFGGGFTARKRARRAPAPERGRDVVVEAEIDFEQAAFGAELTLDSLEIWTTCSSCSGSGAAPGSAPAACPACGGTGEITERRRSLLGSMITSYLCPECEGVGQVVVDRCPECQGEGRVLTRESITVPIQAGIEDGTQLRVRGRGHAGRRGGPPGDLYVSVRVRPHPVLDRRGADLHFDAEISYVQAVLGTTVLVPTLDGDVEVTVPPGVADGTQVRLEGRGVPFLDRPGRGDLVVTVRVHIPDQVSAEERKLLHEIARVRNERVLGGASSSEQGRRRGARL